MQHRRRAQRQARWWIYFLPATLLSRDLCQDKNNSHSVKLINNHIFSKKKTKQQLKEQ
jgi:hypothetical protein